MHALAWKSMHSAVYLMYLLLAYLYILLHCFKLIIVRILWSRFLCVMMIMSIVYVVIKLSAYFCRFLLVLVNCFARIKFGNGHCCSFLLYSFGMWQKLHLNPTDFITFSPNPVLSKMHSWEKRIRKNYNEITVSSIVYVTVANITVAHFILRQSIQWLFLANYQNGFTFFIVIL